MEYYTTSIVSDWFEYNLSYNLNFKPRWIVPHSCITTQENCTWHCILN